MHPQQFADIVRTTRESWQQSILFSTVLQDTTQSMSHIIIRSRIAWKASGMMVLYGTWCVQSLCTMYVCTKSSQKQTHIGTLEIELKQFILGTIIEEILEEKVVAMGVDEDTAKIGLCKDHCKVYTVLHKKDKCANCGSSIKIIYRHCIQPDIINLYIVQDSTTERVTTVLVCFVYFATL